MKDYTFNEFRDDSIKLAFMLQNEGFDALLGIARGGMSLAQFLSHLLGIRACFTISSISYEQSTKAHAPKIFNIPELENYKKVLVVDDIVDSGESLAKVLEVLKERYKGVEFSSAALFYKSTACIKPDYYTNLASEWICFPWEHELSEFI